LRRKGARAVLAKRADKLWSLLVRRAGACEICSSRNCLQGAHGFSRRYRATRWLLLNGFCLCAGCHMLMTYRPLEWDEYIREAWGGKVYDELRQLALSGKYDVADALAELELEAKKASIDCPRGL